jgi:putative nucleotidyltransferase with HDIG domain
LVDLISTDAAFAGEVLTVANSALYAPRYPASSILQAVTVLGAQTLQGMCITVGVRAYLGRTMNEPAMQRMWRHNLACALIAEKFESLELGSRDTAFTAGILHDLGRMGLAVVRPKAYAELLDRYLGPPQEILGAERALFGQDHCETGKQLLTEWHLPAQFSAAISDHHAEVRRNGPWDLGELVKASCRMADAAGFPAFRGCDPASYASVLEDLPERERNLFSADADELSVSLAERIQAIETA